MIIIRLLVIVGVPVLCTITSFYISRYLYRHSNRRAVLVLGLFMVLIALMILASETKPM